MPRPKLGGTLLDHIATRRPAPGTPEEEIFQQLLGQLSRAGRQWDLDACARLAAVIQASGHRCARAVSLAHDMGLDPRWLPRRRTW